MSQIEKEVDSWKMRTRKALLCLSEQVQVSTYDMIKKSAAALVQPTDGRLPSRSVLKLL